jgi:predicted  nucleic acid-binding Zn-ribbon protein
MKRFIIAALSTLSILAVSCYDEQIKELNNRVDKIENEKIATIQEQVASISTSILDMQRMDTQLQGYITALQAQAAELEKSLSSVEKKIEDVEMVTIRYYNEELYHKYAFDERIIIKQTTPHALRFVRRK